MKKFVDACDISNIVDCKVYILLFRGKHVDKIEKEKKVDEKYHYLSPAQILTM